MKPTTQFFALIALISFCSTAIAQHDDYDQFDDVDTVQIDSNYGHFESMEGQKKQRVVKRSPIAHHDEKHEKHEHSHGHSHEGKPKKDKSRKCKPKTTTTSKAAEPTEVACAPPASPLPALLTCTQVNVADLTVKPSSVNEFLCVLNQKPTSNALVHLTFPNIPGNKALSLSECTLTFTPTNYNTPQTIHVVAEYAPNAVTTSAFELDYVVESKTDSFHICDGTIRGVRQFDAIRNHAYCAITGDPHIITFTDYPHLAASHQTAVSGSNAVYRGEWNQQMNVFVTGQYNLVNSSLGLLIQAEYGHCDITSPSNKAQGHILSCVTALALQYKKDSIVIKYDGTATDKTSITSKTDEESNILVDFDKQKRFVTITLDDGVNGFTDGTVLKVLIDAHSKNIIMHILIKLAPIHYKKVDGHCNVWDDSVQVTKTTSRELFCGSKKWTILRDENKKNFQEHLEWAYCHKPAVESNCFQNDNVVPVGVKGKTCSIPTLSNKCSTPECPQCGCSEKNKPDSLYSSSRREASHHANVKRSVDVSHSKKSSEFTRFKSFKSAQASELTSADIKAAGKAANAENEVGSKSSLDKCIAYFGLKNEDDIKEATIYLEQCASDYTLVGKHKFSEGHRNMYLISTEEQIEDGVAKGKFTLNDKRIKKLREALFLGEVKCANDCTKRGVCTSTGCKCSAGFGGSDCSSSTA